MAGLELTPAQRELFFATFRETALLYKACEAIGVTNQQIRGLRRRDREFAAAYDDANAEILELLEDRAVEGALNGFKGKPILNRAGEVVGHERVYENRFLARLLAARDARYRDSAPAAVINNRPGPEPLTAYTDGELDELMRLRQARRAAMRQEGLKVVQGGAARR